MENTRRIELSPLTNVRPFNTEFALASADDVLFCSREKVKSFLFDLMIAGDGYHEMNDFIVEAFGGFMELCSDEYGATVISFTKNFVKLFERILSLSKEEYPNGILIAWYHILTRFSETHYKSSLLACAYNYFKENSEQESCKLEDLIDMGDPRITERLESDLAFAEANKDKRPPVEVLQ